MGRLRMMGADDVYQATVGELFENFRCSLLAILPAADRAKINYGDAETHRDWERLAECHFDAFVRSPIEADRGATGYELRLARYDVDLSDYLTASWLTADPEAPHMAAVVRLLSVDAPFDKVQVVEIDPVLLRAGRRATVSVSNLSLALYRRTEAGKEVIISQVEAME